VITFGYSIAILVSYLNMTNTKRTKMKASIIICALFVLLSCKQGNNDNAQQKKIDSLQTEIAGMYKPGLGEFMSAIQVHHAKLWYAGQALNWKLADFEIQEINESIDEIKKYNTDRPEVASIGMISPAMDSINKAIEGKNQIAFRQAFILLTNTCNNCHKATKHEFNVIKLPDTPPFTNQDFNPAK
jgi:hypothetical protein